MEYIIGIDLGTSGTKTVLFDREGAVIASASEEYPLYQPPRPPAGPLWKKAGWTPRT